jgi:hypothetical protein
VFNGAGNWTEIEMEDFGISVFNLQMYQSPVLKSVPQLENDLVFEISPTGAPTYFLFLPIYVSRFNRNNYRTPFYQIIDLVSTGILMMMWTRRRIHVT